MKRVCLLVLVGVLTTLMLLPIPSMVNAHPNLNPDSQQVQGWPRPPFPDQIAAPAGENLHAQGWPIFFNV